MVSDRIGDGAQVSETRVLPFRGGEGRAPSTVLVRQALSGCAASREVVRGAMAVATALEESSEDRNGAILEDADGVARLVHRTGLTPTEVTAAVKALREVAAVTVRDGALRLDADLLCMLPALAALDWETGRRAVLATGGRLAPSLALLRELARVSRFGPGVRAGDWLYPSVQDLSEETLYGRTAVTQALGDLTRAGLVVRAEQPSRKGLRLRLAADAFGAGPSATRRGAAVEMVRHSAGPAAPRSSDAGVTVQIGGASIAVPAGSRLQLPSGMDYRLEIGPDGGAVIRIDD